MRYDDGSEPKTRAEVWMLERLRDPSETRSPREIILESLRMREEELGITRAQPSAVGRVLRELIE